MMAKKTMTAIEMSVATDATIVLTCFEMALVVSEARGFDGSASSPLFISISLSLSTTELESDLAK